MNRILSFALAFAALHKLNSDSLDPATSCATLLGARLAEQATGWVKPLVSLAGGVINGSNESDIDTIMAG